MFILNIIRRYACCRIFNYHSPDVTTQPIPKNIIQQPLNLSYLDSIKYNDTVPFIPAISLCKVIKVYDGDTITVAAKLSNSDSTVYRFSVRLKGIDSPEIKGKTFAEKELAITARDELHRLIYDKNVYLTNRSMEKYGRLLADVYIGDLHVNKWLLDKNLAIPYDGGTKTRPNEWEDVKF